MNNKALPETCIFTVLKDLSAMYYTSPLGYNRNFSDVPKGIRTSKILLDD